MLYFISVGIWPRKLACIDMPKIPSYSVVCHHTMLRLGCGVINATGIIEPISSRTINSQWHVMHVLTQFLTRLITKEHITLSATQHNSSHSKQCQAPSLYMVSKTLILIAEHWPHSQQTVRAVMAALPAPTWNDRSVQWYWGHLMYHLKKKSPSINYTISVQTRHH
jgi:hypothetical protein